MNKGFLGPDEEHWTDPIYLLSKIIEATLKTLRRKDDSPQNFSKRTLVVASSTASFDIPYKKQEVTF